jgi:hypothetical protein
VLIPLALLAGLAGLLLSPAAPDRFFREVLRLGARFDDWLDLFGAAAHADRRNGSGPRVTTWWTVSRPLRGSTRRRRAAAARA